MQVEIFQIGHVTNQTLQYVPKTMEIYIFVLQLNMWKFGVYLNSVST